MDLKETEHYSRTLSHSQVFNGIEMKALEALVRAGQKVETSAGTPIIESESRVPGLFVILEGSAQVVRGDITLSLMGRGSFFGEISLFGVSFGATATVKAKDKTICLMINKSTLDQWSKSFPEAERIFLHRMCTELCRRLYSTSEKI